LALGVVVHRQASIQVPGAAAALFRIGVELIERRKVLRRRRDAQTSSRIVVPVLEIAFVHDRDGDLLEPGVGTSRARVARQRMDVQGRQSMLLNVVDRVSIAQLLVDVMDDGLQQIEEQRSTQVRVLCATVSVVALAGVVIDRVP